MALAPSRCRRRRRSAPGADTSRHEFSGHTWRARKYRQAQARPLCGGLKPLAASQHLHRWDENLVESLPMHFNGMQLAPLGELIFGIARDWHFAPQHKATLTAVIVELITTNDSFADFVRGATAAWKPPNDEKAAIEQRILSARLDSNNYS